MGKTSIEWVKNPDGSQGDTINITPGCSMRNCDLGKDCYAYQGSPRQTHNCEKCGKFIPHFHPERLEVMAKKKKPTGYFFSSGEFFDEVFSRLEIQKRLDYLGKHCSHHRIYISTKQAQRLNLFNYPPNIWLSVSVNRRLEVWRIRDLLKTNAKIKFVNFEPLYENIGEELSLNLKGIDQVIIGGRTHKGKTTFYPRYSWIKILSNIARKSGCKIFLKNNLELDKQYLIQEFPNIKAQTNKQE